MTFNDGTWEGEAPYKESEHHYIGEDGSEVGNLVRMIMVAMMMVMMMMIVMMMMVIMVIIMIIMTK